MLVAPGRPLDESTKPNSVAESKELTVFQLKFIAGTNLATLARAINQADESARVTIDERTASVIVLATQENMVTIRGLIEKLDEPSVPPR